MTLGADGSRNGLPEFTQSSTSLKRNARIFIDPIHPSFFGHKELLQILLFLFLSNWFYHCWFIFKSFRRPSLIFAGHFRKAQTSLSLISNTNPKQMFWDFGGYYNGSKGGWLQGWSTRINTKKYLSPTERKHSYRFDLSKNLLLSTTNSYMSFCILWSFVFWSFFGTHKPVYPSTMVAPGEDGSRDAVGTHPSAREAATICYGRFAP